MNFECQFGTELIWKSWGDSNEWVLFDSRSRQTHLLDDLSASILKRLQLGSQSVESLANQLIVDFSLDVTARDDVERYVAKLLPRLAELGLIRGTGS